MTIHHATQTKAAKLDIKLIELDDATVAFETEGVLSPAFPTGKEALEAAIAYQNDDEVVEDPAEQDDDGDDGEDVLPSSIVRAKYREEYAARGDASTCGDSIAAAMKEFVTVQDDKGKDAMSMGHLATLAGDNGEDERLAGYVTNGQNPGQCRMNIGNVLRARYNKGESVMIGTEEWLLTEEQMEAAA